MCWASGVHRRGAAAAVPRQSLSAAPRKRVSEQRFEEHREVLEPFMASVAELDRLPQAGEFAGAAAVVERLGSLKRAFALVRRVTDPAGWEAIRQRRTEDMGLSRLARRAS